MRIAYLTDAKVSKDFANASIDLVAISLNSPFRIFTYSECFLRNNSLHLVAKKILSGVDSNNNT